MNEAERESHFSSAENGGQALYLSWSGRASSWKKLLRAYWPAMLLMAGMLGFYLYFVFGIKKTMIRGSIHMAYSPWFQLGVMGLFALNFIVRMQLACIPAMASLPDFDRLRWPSLGTTPISTEEIYQSFIKYTIKYNILLLGLLGVLGIAILPVLDYPGRGTFWGEVTIPVLIYSVIAYCAVGFSLTGLGYIASMKWNKPIAVIGGVFLPVILLIFTGTSMIMQSIMSRYTSEPGVWLYIIDLLSMLVVPEVYIFGAIVSGRIYMASQTEISMFTWMLIQILIALLIWWFVHMALSRKRAADK